MARRPEKRAGAFRTIREVADWLGVPTHVLRFWESKFDQVSPTKGAGGRRYYRPEDMQLLGGIKVLLHDQGQTIRGVAQKIQDEGVDVVAALSPSLDRFGVSSKTRKVIRKDADAPEATPAPLRDASEGWDVPDAEGDGPRGDLMGEVAAQGGEDGPSGSVPDDEAAQAGDTGAEDATPDTPADGMAAEADDQPAMPVPLQEGGPDGVDKLDPVEAGPTAIEDAVPAEVRAPDDTDAEAPSTADQPTEPEPAQSVAPAPSPAAAPSAPAANGARPPSAVALDLVRRSSGTSDVRRLRRLSRRLAALADEVAEDLGQ